MFLRLQVRVRFDGFLERKDLVHDRVDLACDKEMVHVFEPTVPVRQSCTHQPRTKNSLLDRTNQNTAKRDGFVDRRTNRYTKVML